MTRKEKTFRLGKEKFWRRLFWRRLFTKLNYAFCKYYQCRFCCRCFLARAGVFEPVAGVFAGVLKRPKARHNAKKRYFAGVAGVFFPRGSICNSQ